MFKLFPAVASHIGFQLDTEKQTFQWFQSMIIPYCPLLNLSCFGSNFGYLINTKGDLKTNKENRSRGSNELVYITRLVNDV